MAAVSVSERELLRLLRDCLQQTGQAESMWALEASTGTQPAELFPEERAIRRLVSHGQWEQVHFYLVPLKDKEGFSHCQFLVHRQELLELLVSRSDNLPLFERQVREAMLRLQKSCPTKEQFLSLSYLLTLPRLQAHPDYQKWTPANSRLQLFHVIANFLRSHVHPEASPIPFTLMTRGSRLAHLVIRGLLYEQCEEVFEAQQQPIEEESDKALDLRQWLRQQPDSLFMIQPSSVSTVVASEASSTKGCGGSPQQHLASLCLDANQEQREEGFLSCSLPSSLCCIWTCDASPRRDADAESKAMAPPTGPVTPPHRLHPPGGVVSSTPKVKNQTPHAEVSALLIIAYLN